MNPDLDLQRRLASHFVAEAPPQAPDWLLGRTLDLIDTTPQRRTLPRLRWRVPPMPPRARFTIAIVAIAGVGLVGLTFLRGQVIGPMASPSPMATPTLATPSPTASLDAAQI